MGKVTVPPKKMGEYAKSVPNYIFPGIYNDCVVDLLTLAQFAHLFMRVSVIAGAVLLHFA